MSLFPFMSHLLFIDWFFKLVLQKCFPNVKDDKLCCSAWISASITAVTEAKIATETENGIMATNPSETFPKVAVLRKSLTETQRDKYRRERVNKRSYRTCSSTPGTPKLAAVHGQTRSITTGGCSPESTRKTTSEPEEGKQKQSGC